LSVYHSCITVVEPRQDRHIFFSLCAEGCKAGFNLTCTQSGRVCERAEVVCGLRTSTHKTMAGRKLSSSQHGVLAMWPEWGRWRAINTCHVCLPVDSAHWQPFFDLGGRFMGSHIRGLCRAHDFNFAAPGLIAIKLKMLCGKQARPAGQA